MRSASAAIWAMSPGFGSQLIATPSPRHRGDFSEKFSETEIRAKFRELAGTVLTANGVVEAERAVDRIEEWAGISELIDLLCRSGRG